jgi:hypothetical protein
MKIPAVLSIDGGETLSEGTTFGVKPEVGEIIQYWRNGREPAEARVIRIAHLQTEDGFMLVVEAQSIALVR